MNLLERLISQSPWWRDKAWESHDRAIKKVKASGFSFRHLPPGLRVPENLPSGSISIIRGPRQVGKTTELKFLVSDLVSQGVPPRNIGYYSCDDIIHFRELTDLIRVFAKTVEGKRGTGYLLLDEITAVRNWHRAVKSVADGGILENIYLLLTGSSAMDIKRGYERMPGRRGKGFDRAFLPLAFARFCRALGMECPDESLGNIIAHESAFRRYEMDVTLLKPALLEALDKYIRWGGFPLVAADIVREGDVTGDTLDVYRSVMFSEFEKQRRSVSLFLGLMRKLHDVLGSPVSYNSLTRDTGCRSNRMVQDYLGIFSGAFLGFMVPCLDMVNHRPYPKREKKFYSIDPVLWQIIAQGAALAPLPEAALAEQAVAVHLARPMADEWAGLGSLEGLYYYRSRKGKEVDFVFFEGPGGPPFGVEVKYQARVSGWDEQSIAKGIGRGVLVTRDSFKWNQVCHIPVWAFLLLTIDARQVPSASPRSITKN